MEQTHRYKTILATLLTALLVTAHSQAVSIDSWESIQAEIQEPIEERFVATAEFEQTDAVLLVWDSDLGDFLTAVMAALIDSVEIYLLVHNLYEESLARDHLTTAGINDYLIKLITIEFDTVWIRDYGPVSVTLPDGRSGIVDNQYTLERPFDDGIPSVVAEHFDVPVFHSGIALDGGNFLTNGSGLCVTTKQTQDENPAITRHEIANQMRKFLGCEQTLFLNKLSREKTGHADVFAKFVSPDTIIVGQYDHNEDPENALVLDDNTKLLERVALTNGRPLSVVRMPMGTNKDGVFRSFVNSLYVNGTIVVPTFEKDRKRETQVLSIYKKILPAETQLVTVDASEIADLDGAVHCATQNFSYKIR